MDKELHDKAKQMIIDGKTFDEIREATHLRTKDLKRIRKNEISNHF